jgi:hypothetical protein
MELQIEKVATQPTFEKFRLIKLQVPLSRPKFIEEFPFEFELGRKMVHELRSSTKVCGDPMTQKSTPKFMEEVVTKLMKADKAIELLQTMAIMNLNMGNLTWK